VRPLRSESTGALPPALIEVVYTLLINKTHVFVSWIRRTYINISIIITLQGACQGGSYMFKTALKQNFENQVQYFAALNLKN